MLQIGMHTHVQHVPCICGCLKQKPYVCYTQQMHLQMLSENITIFMPLGEGSLTGIYAYNFICHQETVYCIAMGMKRSTSEKKCLF